MYYRKSAADANSPRGGRSKAGSFFSNPFESTTPFLSLKIMLHVLLLRNRTQQNATALASLVSHIGTERPLFLWTCKKICLQKSQGFMSCSTCKDKDKKVFSPVWIFTRSVAVLTWRGWDCVRGAPALQLNCIGGKMSRKEGRDQCR